MRTKLLALSGMVAFSIMLSGCMPASKDATKPAGDEDKPIELKVQQVLKGHKSDVQSVCFSPDGKTLVSGSQNDRTVKFWEAATGKELATMTEESGQLDIVAYCPDGKLVASATLDGTVTFWDTTTFKQVRTFKAIKVYPKQLRALAFSPDSKVVATGGMEDTIVFFWTSPQGRNW